MKKKPNLYFNNLTGDIVNVPKAKAKFLPYYIKKIEFMKNRLGVDIMRFNFDGAIVDVSEHGSPEVAATKEI